MFGVGREQQARYREAARQYLMSAGVSPRDLGRAKYRVKGNTLVFVYVIYSYEAQQCWRRRTVNLDTGLYKEEWTERIRSNQTNLVLYNGRLMCWDECEMSDG